MTPPLNSKQSELIHRLYFQEGCRYGRDRMFKCVTAIHPEYKISRRQVMLWIKNNGLIHSFNKKVGPKFIIIFE